MNRRSTGNLVLLGSLLLLCFVASSLAVPWTPARYPDPSKNLEQCGRFGLVSRICDPDGIVSVSTRNIVDGITKEIVKPKAPYGYAPCDGLPKDRQGFQVGVALMRKMELQGLSPAVAAANFADQLYRQWGIGAPSCGNGALLLLSIDDRQAYIVAGKGHLSRQHIDSVLDRMKPALRAGDYDAAVPGAVVDLGTVLAQQAAGDEGKSDGGGWLVWGVAAGFVGAFLTSCFVGKRRQNRQHSRVQSLLDKLRREQEQARDTGRYPAASCPICFEDFPTGSPSAGATPSAPPLPDSSKGSAVPSAPPLPGPSNDPTSSGSESLEQPLLGKQKQRHPSSPPQQADASPKAPELKRCTLPCGHTFCEGCLEQWLNSNTSCPVCRRPADDQGPSTSSRPSCDQTAQDAYLYDDELLYRIDNMHRRFPIIITGPTRDHLRHRAQEGSLVDWALFREHQMSMQEQAHHAHSGSHGTDWGFSGSDGGGGGGHTVGGGSSW